MDRFRELTAFVTVVEAGGFSAAARRLGESQSAMSKSINALEKRLGVRLFNRSTRSVTLTDLVEDGIDLAIRISPVRDPDSVVRRIAGTTLACVASRDYLARCGTPATPADLAAHNCLIYDDMTDWPFHGPQGRFSVAVRGNLKSDSVETILQGVLAGVGIGMFLQTSLVGELQHPDIVTVLAEFMDGPRDVSLIWPRRRFVAERVRRVTDFFATQLGSRL